MEADDEDIDPEDRQQIDLVAEQEHEHGNADSLNKGASGGEDQPLDGVRSHHRQRGQRLGAVVEFVKRPQRRHPVKGVMHGEAGEIVEQEEEQGEADRRRPVAGAVEQTDRQHRLIVQELEDQGGDGKLRHENRTKPAEQHPVDDETDEVLAARAAEPDAAVENRADRGDERMPTRDAEPENAMTDADRR